MFTKNRRFYLIDHQEEQRQGRVDRKAYGNIARLPILRGSTLQLPELESPHRLFPSLLGVPRIRMLSDAESIPFTDKISILLGTTLL